MHAVSKIIAALTEMSIASISIKRKYKMSPQSSGGDKLSRWWFVIRGDEEVGWKLEPLYSFSDVVVTHQSSDDTVHNSPATLLPQLPLLYRIPILPTPLIHLTQPIMFLF